MGELPDQRVYGLFIARDHAEEWVGRKYLTALVTQRGQPRSSNFVKAGVRTGFYEQRGTHLARL